MNVHGYTIYAYRGHENASKIYPTAFARLFTSQMRRIHNNTRTNMHVQTDTYIGGDPLHFFLSFFSFLLSQRVILYGTRGIVERIADRNRGPIPSSIRNVIVRASYRDRDNIMGRIKITMCRGSI